MYQRAAMAFHIHRHCRRAARRELARWMEQAMAIPDERYREQAIDSIRTKGFHCEGGSVYAAGAPAWTGPLVRAIVAYQTLVDYLDNRCDRMGAVDEAMLRRLHEAAISALRVGDSGFLGFGGPDDGYLVALVEECRENLARLPGYPAVAKACALLGEHYADLQVYKHLPDLSRRKPALVAWLEPLAIDHSGWQWWELAAACGSTLALFALFLAATRPGAPEAGALLSLYFPWVCGLHILLDYYIDQAEDEGGGDFNLVEPYGSDEAMVDGMRRILAECRRRVRALPNPALHSMIIQGLPGLYLSDPKIARQGLAGSARRILRAGGPASALAYWYCRAWQPIR